MRRSPFSALGLALALLLSACAGNPSLPVRQIDRPYTLPADTKEFGLGGGVEFSRNGANSDSTSRIYLTGPWLLPINDTWTWEALLGIRHQFHHDDESTTGFRAGVNRIGYGTLEGLIAEPSLSLYYRRNYSRTFALLHEVGGAYDYHAKRSDIDGWNAYYSVGTLLQLGETTAVTPVLALSLEQRYTPVVASADFFTPGRDTVLAIPLGFQFQWRMSQGWETAVSYNFRGIGYTNGYRAHFADATLIHYW